MLDRNFTFELSRSLFDASPNSANPIGQHMPSHCFSRSSSMLLQRRHQEDIGIIMRQRNFMSS
eukprot:416485-Karenia_brevis.AAC.1